MRKFEGGERVNDGYWQVLVEYEKALVRGEKVRRWLQCNGAWERMENIPSKSWLGDERTRLWSVLSLIGLCGGGVVMASQHGFKFQRLSRWPSG